MSTTYLHPNAELDKIVKATFPRYTGRKFKVTTTTTPQSLKSYWDGGSKRDYVFINLTTMETLPIPDNGTPFTGTLAPEGVPIPPGYALVEHDIFCGKDMGITFLVHPDTMAPALMAPAVELSNIDKLVLIATRSYKNTYAGQSNNRYLESRRYFPKLTLSSWDTAKASLIERGLLNKAGAITIEGKNAIGNLDMAQFKASLQS